MNQQNQPTQPTPINDDQELAKALAGITQDGSSLDLDSSSVNEEDPTTASGAPDIKFPDMPDPVGLTEVAPDQITTEADSVEQITPVAPNLDSIVPTTDENTIITTGQPFLGEEQLTSNETAPLGDLDLIRGEALSELRPLVDKLDLSPEEKFDIYLLLIRSTDDASLIAPAHAVAKTITNESKRAESLLEIIKEIDFLSKTED